MAVSGRTFSLDCPYAGFPITAVFWEKGMSVPLLPLSTLSLLRYGCSRASTMHAASADEFL